MRMLSWLNHLRRNLLRRRRVERDLDDELRAAFDLLVAESHRPFHAWRAERFVERVLASIPVVPFDLDVARVHAQLDAELSASGSAVADADLIIAATAITLDYRIATHDLRSFPRIKGLDVVRW